MCLARARARAFDLSFSARFLILTLSRSRAVAGVRACLNFLFSLFMSLHGLLSTSLSISFALCLSLSHLL